MHQNGQPQLQMQFVNDLEYVYRDFFTVFAGPDDVVLEFGNVSRATPGQVRVADRIVLTPANALRLRELLDRTIDEMRRRMAQGQPDLSTPGANA